jgi:catechol 2,3-dioxygenase-like lactoylglutathione lyase family enzyme
MQNNSNYYINGIQQVGLGVLDVYEAWTWYHKYFGFDLPIFDDEAVAKLMLKYTNNEPRNRHAALVLNYQGGGGLEIWQHKSMVSRPPQNKVMPGDLGIFAMKIKVKNTEISHSLFKKSSLPLLTEPILDKSKTKSFYLSDPYHNLIQVVESSIWNADVNLHSGGVLGCMVGVHDMQRSIKFYKDILGYDLVTSDAKGHFEDFDQLSDARYTYQRVILSHSKEKSGAFSKLLGPTAIELVKVLDRNPQKIFKNRMWGELGYIHLCFDINGMEYLKDHCANLGHSFAVDSDDSFDMGEAAGRFAYIEDPDGTLIEFVETHKVPILKKFGWYFDLRKRPIQKPISKWILRAMALTRIKSIKK